MFRNYTGKLKDLSTLKLKELPLEKISFRDKEVLAISELTITSWLEKNTFNIYDLRKHNKDSITTYKDIIDNNILLDTLTINEFMLDLGFAIINIHDIVTIDNSYENSFEGKDITEDERRLLASNISNAGDTVFVLENF